MLPIAVACDLPPLPPRPSMEWVRRLCLMAAWGVAGLIVAGLMIGPRITRVCSLGNKVDVATLMVRKYAYEAHPAWKAANPELTCPANARELDPYASQLDRHDPWGRSYIFTCGKSGLYAMSLGEDGLSNTADDLWSHDDASRR